MDREKIIEAMETIKSVCEENRDIGKCLSDCPFWYKQGCYIRDGLPVSWKSNKSEEIWRAYKEE